MLSQGGKTMDFKAAAKLDNLSKVFTQLNAEGQDKVVKLVHQLSKSRINTGAGSAKTAPKPIADAAV
jgi:hypothetical protein